MIFTRNGSFEWLVVAHVSGLSQVRTYVVRLAGDTKATVERWNAVEV